MRRFLVFSVPILIALLACAKSYGKTPVILSTDVGNEIDDQWAITYMLASPDLEVLGILSAHAPSLPDPSAHYTYLILKDIVEKRMGMAIHPPLFEGSSVALADARSSRPNAAVDFLLSTSKRFSEKDRLTVLVIGAATDIASAIIQDPTIVQRIRVVAMAFPSERGGEEYNVANDVVSWQVVLDSNAPLVVGSGDVCRAHLALTFEGAQTMIASHGPIGEWLWSEYKAWYYRDVKPLRKNDFSKPWFIWDTIVIAYLEGMTTQESIPRPKLNADMTFTEAAANRPVIWIRSVDSSRMWPDFLSKIDSYQHSHAIESNQGRTGCIW
ncbi:MAG: nucleoside hydrolase [Acidobacteriaceae bacterium]|nr:nucleoside hydrolase [Acidobacteriaceae bacterium]